MIVRGPLHGRGFRLGWARGSRAHLLHGGAL